MSFYFPPVYHGFVLILGVGVYSCLLWPTQHQDVRSSGSSSHHATLSGSGLQTAPSGTDGFAVLPRDIFEKAWFKKLDSMRNTDLKIYFVGLNGKIEWEAESYAAVYKAFEKDVEDPTRAWKDPVCLQNPFLLVPSPAFISRCPISSVLLDAPLPPYLEPQ